MKSKTALMLFSILSVSLVGGLLFQLYSLLSSDNMTSAQLLLTAATVVVMVILIPVLLNLRKDVKAGIPHDDELSKKVKMFAAGYAYFSSLIIWLVLFAFHSYLQKDDLLMVGLAFMILSFGINWLFVRRKGFQ
ncbi:hypothetical protein [Alkalihalobacillus sp. CinArs1]|uniref:hypothetical protein n=1 Tax=Alkalihalobacillus sp. CinArs1 TaxID=2995314 RepID=UPI0022DD6209|nr:hypothetical protein [Alkalihalobacillus sp. CinArs1]